MTTSESGMTSTNFTTTGFKPPMQTNADVNISKNTELGLWECQLTLELPTITVTRYKKDKSDFRYEMSRAVTDVVEQIVEGLIEDEC